MCTRIWLCDYGLGKGECVSLYTWVCLSIVYCSLMLIVTVFGSFMKKLHFFFFKKFEEFVMFTVRHYYFLLVFM